MCGIFCTVSKQGPLTIDAGHEKVLRRRGPDSLGSITRVYPSHDESNCTSGHGCDHTYLTFTSTVLSLRGSSTVTQPYQKDETALLCWNGEAWTVSNELATGNDTQMVFELLHKTIDNLTDPNTGDQDPDWQPRQIAQCLATIAGPFAFVFYCSRTARLYFGRDFLGRRSLLRHITPKGDLILSSVSSRAPDQSWTEVEADGLYSVQLDGNCQTAYMDTTEMWGPFEVSRIPYPVKQSSGDLNNLSVIPNLILNKTVDRSSATCLDHNAASVARLEALLRIALTFRVLNIPDPPRLSTQSNDLPAARLAILFSGGLDCTLLARLAHDLLPLSEPIDLLNVAFENPRVHANKNTCDGVATSCYELCPDRITGRTSLNELCRSCPGRNWRFVAINIPYSETLSHRDAIIKLMHPHNTEMDLSIACALYFAARGAGELVCDGNLNLEFTTTARVLLSGLGADELFAGYTRHATAFTRHGQDALLDELDLDIGRLGKRNLGRDDRVISNWGREVRFPYLDEALVSWALEAPLFEKCGFGEPATDGDSLSSDKSAALPSGKKVLRCLAWKLGMAGVAEEKKRAIQFGARTAKMETGKTKGTTLLA